MYKYSYRALCIGLIISMMLALTSCGKEDDDFAFINSEATITYWGNYGKASTFGVSNMGELPVYQKLMQETGVQIDFINTGTSRKFGIMLASGEYPDVLEYPFYDYPSGPQGAIDEGIILNLNEIIQEKCPNLKKYLSEHPEVDKAIKTDEGNYYCFPGIYDGESLQVYNGPVIRSDLLEKIGKNRPETIQQWTDVLTHFKNDLGIAAPLTLVPDDLYAFTQAFGAIPQLYVDNGTIKNDIVSDSYKQALACFRQWYADGLLDKNFASTTSASVNTAMIHGDSAATVAATGGGIGDLTNSGQKINPEYRLAATKYPVLKKGEVPIYGHRINPVALKKYTASISTKCSNIDAAAKVLDYGYSEEGRLLFNFGIEGVSYNMVDGYPTYTELVTNDANGKAMSDMISYYACPNGVRPALRDVRYMEQFAALPEQKESIRLWSETRAEEHLMPLVTLSAQESVEINQIASDIQSYVNEMTLKFITGVEPLENFDQYVETIKSMGFDKYLVAYQNAYDRYMER